MIDSKVLNVRGVLIKNNKVLLVRHDYENSKGKLLIPGGCLKSGEKLFDAVKRNIFEETNVQAEVSKLLAIKSTAINWWAIFSMEYINYEKELFKDRYGNVVFMDIDEALNHSNVTTLSKLAIQMALNNEYKKLNDIDCFISDIIADDYSVLKCL